MYLANGSDCNEIVRPSVQSTFWDEFLKNRTVLSYFVRHGWLRLVLMTRVADVGNTSALSPFREPKTTSRTSL